MMAPILLITRPSGQHEAFARSCEMLGFKVALLPCLHIQPVNVAEHHLKQALNACQTILFTSANAVRLAHQISPFPWQGLTVHAIGAATARSLAQANQPISMVPKSPYNSEAYIEQLESVPPESLLIIKGRGGRGFIESELQRKGWQVSTLDVYERIKPQVPMDTISGLFNSHRPDIISVSSDEILNNLWELCESQQAQLNGIPLIVNSQRCADRARQLGSLAQVLVAVPAGDTGQLQQLAQWKDKNICAP